MKTQVQNEGYIEFTLGEEKNNEINHNENRTTKQGKLKQKEVLKDIGTEETCEM